MAYLTKNIQSESTLMMLIGHAFPERMLKDLHELTEGYFNIAYEVSFEDGTKSVLKIAPDPKVTVMTYEQNIMEAEVCSMRLAAQKTNIPLPEVEFYDPSCTLCSSPYFFMQKLNGKSLSSQKPLLTSGQVSHIHFLVGSLNKEINRITNGSFGYPGKTALQGKIWFDVFAEMLRAVILDAEKESIDLTISSSELFGLLEQDKGIFKSIVTPRLVHWDIWDGNIFIEDGKLTGIIDWERCLWGDPLMEVGFRSYAQSADFLRGYGIEEFAEEEKRRIVWYDLYLLMIVAQEPVYRGYETADAYHWATALLREKYTELQEASSC
ncbi:phosphotransferase family protein [Kineothrix sp. MB12-C1]|uniref:phosphotransferase family protein n=1 Tax=Kineothrix sp. MB12-C1 TaxID=3070215 RepID=UPI0027D34EDE|nr:aminoglycoside phosphotransferase family protein [Kineothrix sp. MB12-C1]WMC91382.1 aminoglycoside phosphotransferase family protein [Kineothrix sp. MB12-C1]